MLSFKMNPLTRSSQLTIKTREFSIRHALLCRRVRNGWRPAELCAEASVICLRSICARHPGSALSPVFFPGGFSSVRLCHVAAPANVAAMHQRRSVPPVWPALGAAAACINMAQLKCSGTTRSTTPSISVLLALLSAVTIHNPISQFATAKGSIIFKAALGPAIAFPNWPQMPLHVTPRHAFVVVLTKDQSTNLR